MKRSARAFVVAVIIGALLPGCGEAFAIASGAGLAIGTAAERPGGGLITGAICGTVFEIGLRLEYEEQKRLDDYFGSFFFRPMSVPSETYLIAPAEHLCYGMMIAGGVLTVGGLLAWNQDYELAYDSTVIGVALLASSLVLLPDARDVRKGRKTSLLFAPTGVGVAYAF